MAHGETFHRSRISQREFYFQWWYTTSCKLWSPSAVSDFIPVLFQKDEAEIVLAQNSFNSGKSLCGRHVRGLLYCVCFQKTIFKITRSFRKGYRLSKGMRCDRGEPSPRMPWTGFRSAACPYQQLCKLPSLFSSQVANDGIYMVLVDVKAEGHYQKEGDT